MDTLVRESSGILVRKSGRLKRMKSIFTIKIFSWTAILFLTLASFVSFGQGVGIGEKTFTPHSTAILELRHMSGTFKGFLTPSMTTVERNGIAGPATGLIIYNTTTNKLNIFDGTTWRVLFSGDTGINDIFGTANRITIDKTDVANPIIDISNTYVGQASITTLGTITTGTWNASTVEVPYGGTGLNSIAANNLLYGNGTGAISLLAPHVTTGAILMNTASGAPSWSLLSNIPNTGLTPNSGVYTNATSGLTTAAPTTGILGYWTRTGTTLSPSNVGDDITTTGDISTSGTGTITSAGLLTAQNGIDVTNGDVDVADNVNIINNLDVSGATTLDQTSIVTDEGAFAVSGTNPTTITTASTSVTSSSDAAGAISLTTNGGPNETLAITNTQGTAANAIDVNATDGGIDIDGGTGVAINATTNNVDITAATNTNISATTSDIDINAGDEVLIDASAGISIDAGAASNFTTSAGALTLDGATGVNIAGNASEVDITTTGNADI
ncbi:MAG: hypothetical protein RBT49_14025, partial [Bacteroidales bacterium]|nr:hypothetical protein [Bacteroidales bacterium]